MKLLNLKFIALLFCLVFSFNSSARIFERVLTDVTKAAKAGGSDISGWKTCEDDGGGFNPDHVHKVYEMGNSKTCEYDSPVVTAVSQNIYRMFSKRDGSAVGMGILSPDCKGFMTVAHIYHKGLGKNEGYYLRNPNNNVKLEIDRSSEKSDSPQGMIVNHDKAYVDLQKNTIFQCKSLKFEILSQSDIDKNREEGAQFFILKTDLKSPNRRLCSQECSMYSAATGQLPMGKTANMFVHDCNTDEGNSGSPIVMLKDGVYSVIALHSGGRTYNEDSKSFKKGEHVNQAQPITQDFLDKKMNLLSNVSN